MLRRRYKSIIRSWPRESYCPLLHFLIHQRRSGGNIKTSLVDAINCKQNKMCNSIYGKQRYSVSYRVAADAGQGPTG